MCELNLKQGELKKENPGMFQANRQQEAAEQRMALRNQNDFYAGNGQLQGQGAAKKAVKWLVPGNVIKDLVAGLEKEKDEAAQSMSKLQDEIALFRQEKDNLTKQMQSHQELAAAAEDAVERAGALQDVTAIKNMADAFEEAVKAKERELGSKKSEYEKIENYYQAAREIAASNDSIPLIWEELSVEKETIAEADKEHKEAYLEKADCLAGFIRNLEKICQAERGNNEVYETAIGTCRGYMEQLTDAVGKITLQVQDFSALQNTVEASETELKKQADKYAVEAGELTRQRDIFFALHMAAAQWKKDGAFVKFTNTDCDRVYRERADIKLEVDEFVKRLGEYGEFSKEAAAIYEKTYKEIYRGKDEEIGDLEGGNARIYLKKDVIPAKKSLALIKQLPDWIEQLEDEANRALETDDISKKAMFLDKLKQMQELTKCSILQQKDETNRFTYIIDYVEKHKRRFEATAKMLCKQIYCKQVPEDKGALDLDLDNLEARLKSITDMNEMADVIVKYSLYTEMGDHPRLRRIDRIIFDTITNRLKLEDRFNLCCVLHERKYAVSKRMKKSYENLKEKLGTEISKDRVGAVSGLIVALSADAALYNDGLVRLQQLIMYQESSFLDRIRLKYREDPRWKEEEEAAGFADDMMNKFHSYKKGLYEGEIGDWKRERVEAYVSKNIKLLPDQIIEKMKDYMGKEEAKAEDKQTVQAVLCDTERVIRLTDFCISSEEYIHRETKEKQTAFLRVPPVLKAYMDKLDRVGTILDLKEDEGYITIVKKLEKLYRDVLNTTIGQTRKKLDYESLINQYAGADKQDAVRLIEFDRQHGDWLAQLQQERKEILNSPDMGRKYRFLDNVQRLAEFAKFKFMHKDADRTEEERLFANIAEWYSVHREEFQETVALVSEQIFRQQSPDFFKPLRINPESAHRKLRNKNKMKDLAKTMVKVSMYNSNYDEKHYGNLNERITMLKNEVERISEGTDFTEEEKAGLMKQFQKIRYDYSVKIKKVYEKIKKNIPADIPQERAGKMCGYLTSLTDVAQFYFAAEAISGYYMMTSVNFTNESVSEMLAEIVDDGPRKYRNVVTEIAEMKNDAKKYENNFDVSADYMENKIQDMIIDINKEGIANMH